MEETLKMLKRLFYEP